MVISDFKYWWIVAKLCCYFDLTREQISAFHPTYQVCKVKKYAAYFLWRSGATYYEAGQIIGLKAHTTGRHIREMINSNDAELERLKRIMA